MGTPGGSVHSRGRVNNPEALRQLHIEFREAGAEVLQALTRQRKGASA